MDNDMQTATKAEILGQTEAWEATLAHVLSRGDDLRTIFGEEPLSEALFIGCGSTHYLSLSASATFQMLSGRKARALPSSELLLFPDAYLPSSAASLLVPISRSGETTETLQAAREFAESNHGGVVPITCYGESLLARRYPKALVVKRAQESSVAQTRSFSTMLLAAQLLAGIVSDNQDYCTELRGLPAHGHRLIHEQRQHLRQIAESDEYDAFVFLGSGPRYGLACEAMLKMKEMSLSPSEAYHFLEYRHGPKSVLNERTLVVGLLSGSARDYEAAVLSESQAMGARTLVLAEDGGEPYADHYIPLHSGLSELAQMPLYMPLVQLLAYYRAVWKRLNPDAPQHLEAVVRLG